MPVSAAALEWAIKTAPTHPHGYSHEFGATPLQILIEVGKCERARQQKSVKRFFELRDWIEEQLEDLSA